MTDLRAAAEMALDYIKDIRDHCACEGIDFEKEDVLVEALRQALAQDEQEPVIDRRLKVKIGRQYGYALNEHWFYLQPADEYAEQALTKHSGISAPPSKPWVSLTDEEIIAINHKAATDYEDGLTYARAIEAATKELNT